MLRYLGAYMLICLLICLVAYGLPGASDNSDVASLDVRCYMEDVPILHKPDKHSQYLLVWQDVFG